LRDILLTLPGRKHRYRIILEPGLRRRLAEALAPLNLPPRIFLVADARVARLYGQEVTGALSAGGYRPEMLTVPPGERSKSWGMLKRLAQRLLALGADRACGVLALGGGVVGDLAGFLASIYLRGVPFVQIPTTLLAMVDASIGGKTAVNLPQGKNLLGTFHQPRLVAIDPEFLDTLPRRERLNGLAEILKAGFIRDPDLLTRLAALHTRLFQDPESLADIIFRAAEIKARVVAADEKEADLRRILNFGHTLGHALEQASGFSLPHGQAVAFGMIFALDLSVRLTGLPPDTARSGHQLIRNFGLAQTLPALDHDAILAALPQDKKRQDQDLVFVLLKDLGQPVIYRGAPLPLIAKLLGKMQEL
jgi:3-dehydroquinate synthase